VALVPGLVNAHTHLEFSHLQRPLGSPGMRLVDWIRLVIAERGRRNDAPAPAIEDGMRESLCRGVSCIGDITSAAAATQYDDRFDLTLFAEAIGFSPARAESAYAAVLVQLLEEDQARRDRRAAAGVRLGISPHAPYTVSPELLRRLVGLARARNLPVAMHVAESAEELALLAGGTGPFRELLEERSMWDAAAVPRGSRPMDYLRMLAEAPRSLVIHGNYLDGDERAFLAAHSDRMSLVYCPRTHAYFGHPPYPLAELLSAGVRVALGTDSRASNPDLDLLAEMRFVAQAQAGIDRQVILRMGTLSGAEALGRAEEVGSITPGKLANLVAIPLPPEARGKPGGLAAAMLAGSAPVSGVWIRGERCGAPPLV
jgi:cytosine/adenosine deaminase-related metal-dependent hydrolase